MNNKIRIEIKSTGVNWFAESLASMKNATPEFHDYIDLLDLKYCKLNMLTGARGQGGSDYDAHYNNCITTSISLEEERRRMNAEFKAAEIEFEKNIKERSKLAKRKTVAQRLIKFSFYAFSACVVIAVVCAIINSQ